MNAQNRPLLATLVLGVIFAVAVALGGSMLTPDDGDLPPGVIATVDGFEVTEQDWDMALFEVERSLVYMRAQVALVEPPGGPEMQSFMARYLEALEARPPEVAALTSLVVNRATAAAAFAAGLAPSEDEVVAAVTEQRDLTTEALAHGGFDEWNRETFELMLERVGEDAYWEQFLPDLLRRGLANQRLFERERHSPESWRTAEVRLARSADVVLGPRVAARASVDGVLDYLDELEDIEWANAAEATSNVVR